MSDRRPSPDFIDPSRDCWSPPPLSYSPHQPLTYPPIAGTSNQNTFLNDETLYAPLAQHSFLHSPVLASHNTYEEDNRMELPYDFTKHPFDLASDYGRDDTIPCTPGRIAGNGMRMSELGQDLPRESRATSDLFASFNTDNDFDVGGYVSDDADRDAEEYSMPASASTTHVDSADAGSSPHPSGLSAPVGLLLQELHADGRPRRPMNAFMIYSRHRRPDIQRVEPGLKTGDMSKRLSLEWKNLAPAKKAFYTEQAKILKDIFHKRFPKYIYRRKPNGVVRKRTSINNTLSSSSSSRGSSDTNSSWGSNSSVGSAGSPASVSSRGPLPSPTSRDYARQQRSLSMNAVLPGGSNSNIASHGQSPPDQARRQEWQPQTSPLNSGTPGAFAHPFQSAIGAPQQTLPSTSAFAHSPTSYGLGQSFSMSSPGTANPRQICRRSVTSPLTPPPLQHQQRNYFSAHGHTHNTGQLSPSLGVSPSSLQQRSFSMRGESAGNMPNGQQTVPSFYAMQHPTTSAATLSNMPVNHSLNGQRLLSLHDQRPQPTTSPSAYSTQQQPKHALVGSHANAALRSFQMNANPNIRSARPANAGHASQSDLGQNPVGHRQLPSPVRFDAARFGAAFNASADVFSPPAQHRQFP